MNDIQLPDGLLDQVDIPAIRKLVTNLSYAPPQYEIAPSYIECGLIELVTFMAREEGR